MDGIPEAVRIDLVEDRQFVRLLTIERLQAVAGATARVRGFTSVEELLDDGDIGDVVLLDLLLEGGGVEGTEAIERLARAGHLVLVLSDLHSAEALERAYAAGARGYVSKGARPDDLIQGIGDVLAGRNYVDPILKEEIGAAARRFLTIRQQEVLRLEALGRTTGQIARALDLSDAGVRRHVERIISTYPECGKQTERVRLAIRLGLVSPWDVYRRPGSGASP